MAFVLPSQYAPTRGRGRLDWRRDPLAGARKESITPGMARTGLQFNRDLYAPDSQLLRDVVSGPVRQPETWQGGPRTSPIIQSKYGFAKITSGADRGTPLGGAINPHLPSQPPSATPLPGDTGPAGIAGPDGAGNPNLADVPAAPSPYLESGMDDASLTPEPVNVGSGGAGPLDARQEWINRGGSNRTFNRANVTRGVRSGIDARSNPDRKGSTASADIRAKWGWNTASPQDLPY